MCIPNNIQQFIVQIIQHFPAVNTGGQWGHGQLTRNTSGPYRDPLRFGCLGGGGGHAVVDLFPEPIT